MLKTAFIKIIEKIGIPVELYDFRYTYNSTKPNIGNRVEEFEKKLKEIGKDISPIEFDEKVAKTLFERIKQLMIEYQDIFDKEKYILYMAKALLICDVSNQIEADKKDANPLELHFPDELDGNRRIDTYMDLPISKLMKTKSKFLKYYSLVNADNPFTNKNDALTAAINYMKDRNFDHTCVVFEKDGVLSVITSHSLTGRGKEYDDLLETNKQKFETIDEEFGMEKILKKLSLEDLANIAMYKTFGDRVYKTEKMIQNRKYKIDQKDKLDEKQDSKLGENNNSNYSPFPLELFNEHFKHLDPDKLLLVALNNYYKKHGNDLKEFEEKEVKELKDMVSKMEKIFGGNEVTVLYTTYKAIKYREKEIIVPISEKIISFKELKSKIEDLDRHFINGQYRTEDEIGDIRNDIINGKRNIDNYSDEDIRHRLIFSDPEFAIILNRKPSLITRFVSENIFLNNIEESDEVKKKIIKERCISIINWQIKNQPQNTLPFEEIRYLIQNGILNSSEVFEFYMKGQISLEDLQRLQETHIENVNFEDLVNEDDLVKLFLSMHQNDKDSNDNKDNSDNSFFRYRDAYIFFIINGKTDDEKCSIADSIMEKSDELWETDVVTELYQMGLIPVDKLFEPLTQKERKNLVKEKKIKRIDLKRVLDDDNYEEISYQFIDEIMLDPELDILIKFMIAVDIYPGLTPEDIRNRARLLWLANVYETKRGSIYESGGGEGREEPLDIRKARNRGNRYKTDIVFRYMFLTYFDKEDVSVEVCEDGNVIIYLPKIGEYIIEKMFTIDSGYGQKTFIFDEEVFNNNRHLIIKNKKDGGLDAVSVTQANRVCDNNQNTLKVIHSTDIEKWVMAICEHFEACEYNQELDRLEIVDPELREIANCLINSREIIIDGFGTNMQGDDNEEPNQNPDGQEFSDV